MVVRDMLARRCPPILILICLLTLWNTKLRHNVDLRLQVKKEKRIQKQAN